MRAFGKRGRARLHWFWLQQLFFGADSSGRNFLGSEVGGAGGARTRCRSINVAPDGPRFQNSFPLFFSSYLPCFSTPRSRIRSTSVGGLHCTSRSHPVLNCPSGPLEAEFLIYLPRAFIVSAGLDCGTKKALMGPVGWELDE